ncbi:MAG TPA: SPOR domain-containing protein [Rhizomicrobium sp.]|nr:SPOR domain-containing protein [Rhizomicrobium sp.]
MSEREPPKKGKAALKACSALILPALAAVIGISATPAAASIRHHHGSRVAIPGGTTDPQKDAALILDGSTGKVLFSRNAEATRHPASLTKMMTLYLLFEQLKNGQMTLATPLPVSEHAAIQHRTKLYLRPGSTIPVESAIRAIVVCSANDVAVAIAESIGGSESHFAELMTEKARQLGMSHTFYHNASGLPDDLQVTTASDLSILARHLAYDFPQYFPYFSTQTFNWHGETHQSTDHLLGIYQGADGIKTGYTQASGFNLVSSVVRGGAHVIAVVMGGRTARRRDAEMIHLLDNTFQQINQNPTLVARNTVPWQSIAQNAQSTPVIAGFQIAAAGAIPRAPEEVANLAHPGGMTDPEDEAAAESRIEPDELSISPAPTSPQQPQLVQQQQPQVHAPAPPPPAPAAPLPQPTRTAMLALTAAAPPPPVPTPAPVRVIPLQPPQQAAKVDVPQPMPRPQTQAAPAPVMLAAYHPQPAPVATPKAHAPAITAPAAASTNLGIAHTLQSPQNVHNWTIQIGAFGDEISAKAQLSAYAERSMDVLGQASRIVVPFQGLDGHTMYRARFGPFGEREAREVCERLTERGQTCFAVVAER